MAVGEAVHVILVLLDILALIATATFHGVSWYREGIEYGIFSELEGELWDSYKLDLVVSDWLFYTWMVVYGFQFLWLMYSLFAPCHQTKGGSFGVAPPILSASIYLMFLLSLGGIVGWLLLWNTYHDQYGRYGIVCMSAAAIFSCVGISISISVMRVHWQDMADQGFTSHLRWIQFSVHNGLGLIAGWAMIYILINMAAVLTESELLDIEEASYVMTGILMGYILILILLDVLLTKDILQFMVTPYLLGCFVFYMVVYNKGSTRDPVFAISVVFLALTAVLVFIKMALAVGRMCQGPEPKKKPLDDSDPDNFGAVAYENNGGPHQISYDDLPSNEELWTY